MRFEAGEERLDTWEEGLEVERWADEKGPDEGEIEAQTHWQAPCKTLHSPLAPSLACSCPRRFSSKHLHRPEQVVSSHPECKKSFLQKSSSAPSSLAQELDVFEVSGPG